MCVQQSNHRHVGVVIRKDHLDEKAVRKLFNGNYHTVPVVTHGLPLVPSFFPLVDRPTVVSELNHKTSDRIGSQPIEAELTADAIHFLIVHSFDTIAEARCQGLADQLDSGNLVH